MAQDIKDFLIRYERGTVAIGDSVRYDQRDVIEKNHQMKNGQYENRYFADGETEKYYYNVIFGFAQTLKRGSRLKLSEFSLTSLNGKLLKFVDVVKMGIKHFLRYNGFIEKKDEVLDDLVDMGHVLTKVVDGEVTLVDLRNFVFKPNMKSAKEEGGAERVNMTYEEAYSIYKDNEHWEEIEEHYEKISKTSGELHFIEYACIDKFDIDGKEEFTKGYKIYLDRSNEEPDETNKGTDWEAYLEIDSFASPYFIKTSNKRERKLYGEKRRVFNYDEQRLIPITGRYLGMGVYELCRPAQEDYNEKRNLKRKFDRIALRGILVHKIGSMRESTDGDALTQEFLKRVDTGAAVKIFSDESLERLNIGSTTGDTVSMTNDLFEFMRFMLGVTPVAIGQDSNNKTASFAVIQNQTQQSTYQVIKNKTARLFERLFQDFLIEDIVEEMLEGNTIGLYGDKEDLMEMDKWLVTNEVHSELKKRPVKTSKEQVDATIQARVEAQQGQARFIDLSDKGIKRAFKKLLKDISYIVEFNITDEAWDPNTKIKTIMEADKMTNPKLRDIILDQVGVSPQLFKETDEEKEKAMKEEAIKARLMAEAQNVPEQPVMSNAPIA